MLPLTQCYVVLGYLIMMAAVAYIVRCLQLVLGSSKRAVTERAEEMGSGDDMIPLSDLRQAARSNFTAITDALPSEVGLGRRPVHSLDAPPRTQDPLQIRVTGGPPADDLIDEAHLAVPTRRQTPLPLTRPQRWAAFISLNLDRITFTALFLIIGLPVYYITGYAMPAQLMINVLAYFAALAIPSQWMQFLHPVLISSAITVLSIWVLGLTRGYSLQEVLHAYKTGTKYLQLWKGETNLQAPGAGDIFSSVLDASIVALALPMFRYRMELKQHFLLIVLPNVAIAISSLFAYPYLCHAIGISSQRSLSFAARSLTLALATPAVSNLGGDLNTVAALCIMSGILGVLIGPYILRWLRIPEGAFLLE
jgi:putative effector of murein hydrolase